METGVPMNKQNVHMMALETLRKIYWICVSKCKILRTNNEKISNYE